VFQHQVIGLYALLNALDNRSFKSNIDDSLELDGCRVTDSCWPASVVSHREELIQCITCIEELLYKSNHK
jgi:hypothetical protein